MGARRSSSMCQGAPGEWPTYPTPRLWIGQATVLLSGPRADDCTRWSGLEERTSGRRSSPNHRGYESCWRSNGRSARRYFARGSSPHDRHPECRLDHTTFGTIARASSRQVPTRHRGRTGCLTKSMIIVDRGSVPPSRCEGGGGGDDDRVPALPLGGEKPPVRGSERDGPAFRRTASNPDT